MHFSSCHSKYTVIVHVNKFLILLLHRLCGGLIADIRRRARWYYSDFKDALNPQCIASIIFIYFACLTPIITFGGLMGTKTGKNMVIYNYKCCIFNPINVIIIDTVTMLEGAKA